MSRKDTLRAMLSRRDEKLPDGNPAAPTEIEAPVEVAPRPVVQVRSGAVGAMGRSLGQIASAAEQARALVASGIAVVEISVDRIENSFITDRLPDSGPDHDRLMEAIRDSGQRSPILVRPHPDKPDRYQIVFGHRRVRVLASLGRPVRAVVQNLSDEELVVIQGQENSARTDLSYIERGLFAVALEERSFDRRVLMAALGMEKTQLSRLLALAHAVPRDIATAIGPAPRAGRPRWAAMAERLSHMKGRAELDQVLADAAFRNADSDTRFLRVFEAVAPKRHARKAHKSVWRAAEGRKVAVIERGGTKLSVTIDEKDAPGFGEFLASQLPAIHEAFQHPREEAAKSSTE